MKSPLVDSIDQISHNVLTLNRYGTGNLKQKKFHHDRIKNGKLFVVPRQRKGYLFAPSKFSGYTRTDFAPLTGPKPCRNSAQATFYRPSVRLPYPLSYATT